MLARFRIIPRDEHFFDTFERSANNILAAAQVLAELLDNIEDIERKARHLKELEHYGDSITHEVFGSLNRTFVTPIDREDISRLASALDDVIDWMEEIARRLRLYHITETRPVARTLGRVILEQAELIARGVPLLKDSKRARELDDITREIHRLENEADDLLADVVATIYDGVTEVPQLIEAMRWSDIFQLLEDTTDKAEHVATVLQNISIKNA